MFLEGLILFVITTFADGTSCVILLTRGRNFATLTDAGELFYEEAREVLARADLAVERVRGGKQKEVLRVGYGPTLTAGIMPAALERFQAMTPHVHIELCDLSPREISELAGKGQLDLLIAPGGARFLCRGFSGQNCADYHWCSSCRLLIPWRN